MAGGAEREIPKRWAIVISKGKAVVISNLEEALTKATALLSEPTQVRRIVISGKQRNKNPEFLRISIRPVQLKSGLHWQVVSHDGKKDLTKNSPIEDLNLESYFYKGYANFMVETEQEQLNLRITKSGKAEFGVAKISTGASREINLSHDRDKSRLLPESDPIFQALGISDHHGVLKPTRTDKFKQVQEFLRNIEAAISAITNGKKNKRTASEADVTKSNKTIKIVDLGCGHAYLTFAAYKYLENTGYEVEVLGVDERADSRDRNTKIAQQLGISNQVKFVAQRISELSDAEVDIAIALHACDTATDDAIAWAVKNHAAALLIAPCCHHDIQKQISTVPSPWNLTTRHGILRERLADIITDSLRAQILKILGYRSEIIEFIAGTHTPRNLMIRAFRVDSRRSTAKSAANQESELSSELEEYDKMLQQWAVRPKLQELLATQLDALR